MGPEWTNPWAELRARDHIVFALRRLPAGLGAVYWPRGDRAAIIIDRDLDQRARRCALAHELVHEQRGPPPSDVPWIRRKEEACVDREVALRLVPLDRLAELVSRLEDLDEPVHALDVVEAFDVDVPTAQRALALLEMRWAR